MLARKIGDHVYTETVAENESIATKTHRGQKVRSKKEQWTDDRNKRRRREDKGEETRGKSKGGRQSNE